MAYFPIAHALVVVKPNNTLPGWLTFLGHSPLSLSAGPGALELSLDLFWEEKMSVNGDHFLIFILCPHDGESGDRYAMVRAPMLIPIDLKLAITALIIVAGSATLMLSRRHHTNNDPGLITH